MEEKMKTVWPQWIVAITTFLYAVATFFIVWQNHNNISLTKISVQENQEDAFLRWRPELYIENQPVMLSDEERKEQESIMKQVVSGTATNLGIQLQVLWGNSGGSPALKIYRIPTVNRTKEPIADKMQYKPTVFFALWPNQKYSDEVVFDVSNHAPKDDMYAHIPAFYEDRKGNIYWSETIYFCRFEGNKLIRFGVDGVYEGIKMKGDKNGKEPSAR